MPVIRCNVCLGMTELPEGMALANCSFCGSQITAPVTTDKQPDAEMYAAAFDRGNHFHRIGEFDKALAVFERIILEDETNAQAHWACALCRFGIEFVEDPVTHAFLPTCHRASYDSFLEDVDYIAALKYADDQTRPLYEHWGSQIAQVLRSIISVSQQEEPFDVFLCYKETGADGQRTRDSQLAQDIYYELTDEGLRVFFARITLEDRPGVQYEPYIFSALNSAKVMVVVGTRPEHLNAVWVKNEWSRFLSLMKNDRQRLLIPCYRDMDPYDMPEQLSILQSYDMSRIGFAQDLIRGISKVVNAGKEEDNADDEPAAPSVESLLRRVTLFLEDGDWGSANIYCEKVLDIDPECARAYLGKLMAALKVHKQEDLQNLPQAFAGNLNYQKVLRFADTRLAEDLQAANKAATERHRHAQLEAAYQKAEQALAAAKIEQDFVNAREQFTELGDWRDAPARAQESETARKDYFYNSAISLMRGSTSLTAYSQALRLLQSVPDWRDSLQQIERCQQNISTIEAEEQARREARISFARASRRHVIAAGFDHTVGLQADGVSAPSPKKGWLSKLFSSQRSHSSVVAVGRNLWDECNVSNWMDVVAVAAYFNYTIGLKADGTVVAAGYCDHDVSGWTNMVAIAAGSAHIVGLRANGTVVAMGKNDEGQCNVRDWTDVVAIAAGFNNTVGLKADGTVVTAGKNDEGQCDVSGWTDVVAIAAGSAHTVGLRANGTVVAVGNNNTGQRNVRSWTDVVAIAAGAGHTVGLRANGTVVAVGNNDRGRCDVSDWTDVVAIAAGSAHTVGLRADGTVVAVGSNEYHQCDVADWRLKPVPRPTLPK